MRTALLLGILAAGTTGSALGQLPDPLHRAGAPGGETPLPDRIGEFTLFAANGLLGGTTAGLVQLLQGGSFSDGFTRGFIGGGIVYGGKRLAVARFEGAGLLGRQLAATGASITHNAAEGRGSLDRLVLPLGPTRLYLDRAEAPLLRLKLDLNSTLLIGYALLQSELDFDAGASLSAGAPVFRAPGHLFGSPDDPVRAAGQVVEGVIFLSEVSWRPEQERDAIFAHERVHVLQRDQLFTTLSEPASAWAAGVIPGGSGFYRYLDLHATGALFGLLRIPYPAYRSRPWEIEAHSLTGGDPAQADGRSGW